MAIFSQWQEVIGRGKNIAVGNGYGGKQCRSLALFLRPKPVTPIRVSAFRGRVED